MKYALRYTLEPTEEEAKLGGSKEILAENRHQRAIELYNAAIEYQDKKAYQVVRDAVPTLDPKLLPDDFFLRLHLLGLDFKRLGRSENEMSARDATIRMEYWWLTSGLVELKKHGALVEPMKWSKAINHLATKYLPEEQPHEKNNEEIGETTRAKKNFERVRKIIQKRK